MVRPSTLWQGNLGFLLTRNLQYGRAFAVGHTVWLYVEALSHASVFLPTRPAVKNCRETLKTEHMGSRVKDLK